MDTWDPIAKDVKENHVKEKKTGIKYDPAMNRTRGGSRRRNRGGGQIKKRRTINSAVFNNKSTSTIAGKCSSH